MSEINGKQWVCDECHKVIFIRNELAQVKLDGIREGIEKAQEFRFGHTGIQKDFNHFTNTWLADKEKEIKGSNVEKKEQRFLVTFNHWDSETGENICDFCEKEQVRWYCEFLVTGYCEKCMKEQIEDYEGGGGE